MPKTISSARVKQRRRMIEQGDELFMRSYQNICWTEPVVYQCRRPQGTTYRNVYEFLAIQRINKPRVTFLDYARVPNENLRSSEQGNGIGCGTSYFLNTK